MEHGFDLSSLFEGSKSNGCTKNPNIDTENIRKAKFWFGSLSECVIEIYDYCMDDGYEQPNLGEKRAKIELDHAYCNDPKISSPINVEHAYCSKATIAENSVNATIRKSPRCRKMKMPGGQANDILIQKLKHADDSHLPLKVVNILGKNRGVVTTERLSK